MHIAAIGTRDAGDRCDVVNHVFIGSSHRTNAAGAAQPTAWLSQFGHTAPVVDIRGIDGIRHLDSGIAAIDPGRLVLINDRAEHSAFAGFDILRVPGVRSTVRTL